MHAHMVVCFKVFSSAPLKLNFDAVYFFINKESHNLFNLLMGCAPNNIAKLNEKYGDKLLHWVESQFGANILKSQFGITRDAASKFFDTGNFSESQKSLLPDILAKITDAETHERNEIYSNKPQIPELDQLDNKKKVSFMKKAEKFFKDPLNKYKSSMLDKLGEKGILDYKKYIPSSFF